MNVEEARIAAHICGDGWLTTYLDRNSLQIVHGKKYRQKRIRYVIGYCNTRKELLNEFEKDMVKQFNITPVKRVNDIRFKSKRVYDRIAYLGGNKSRCWFISKEIIDSDDKIKSEWLRAFFDDECTFDPVSQRIRVKSMNEKGLKQVQILLSSINIPSNITGQNCDESFYLTIKRKDIHLFLDKITLKHKIKNNKIDKLYPKQQ